MHRPLSPANLPPQSKESRASVNVVVSSLRVGLKGKGEGQSPSNPDILSSARFFFLLRFLCLFFEMRGEFRFFPRGVSVPASQRRLHYQFHFFFCQILYVFFS